VVGLVVGDHLREALEVGAVAVGLVGDGLLVELGLEELERQREVEDLHVVGLGALRRGDRGLGAGQERAEHRAAGDQAAAREGALLEEVAAVQPGCLGGLADGAVGIDDFKVEMLRQGILLEVGHRLDCEAWRPADHPPFAQEADGA
jgi:hypothetical protein